MVNQIRLSRKLCSHSQEIHTTCVWTDGGVTGIIPGVFTNLDNLETLPLLHVIKSTAQVQHASISLTYRRWWRRSCWPSRCCPHEAPGWTGLPRHSGWCCAERLPSGRRCTPDQCSWWTDHLHTGRETRVRWGQRERKTSKRRSGFSFVRPFNPATDSSITETRETLHRQQFEYEYDLKRRYWTVFHDEVSSGQKSSQWSF